MTARRTRLRAFAMLFGLALLAALPAVPARAIDPYPGETQEAFAARARLDQQARLATADAAAGMADQGGGGSFGSALKLSAVGLVLLMIGGLRLSRGVIRASRDIARAGGAGGTKESFEDRLAEKLRELERAGPAEAAPAPPAPPDMPDAPARAFAAGPRTFGRRVS